MTDLWKIETRLWLEGVGAYEEMLATECVMVFGPMGILHRDSIVESLRNAPRWSSVRLSGQSKTVREGVAILAYQASGTRQAGEAYNALCTSTYVLEESEWRLAQHQQTPIER